MLYLQQCHCSLFSIFSIGFDSWFWSSNLGLYYLSTHSNIDICRQRSPPSPQRLLNLCICTWFKNGFMPFSFPFSSGYRHHSVTTSFSNHLRSLQTPIIYRVFLTSRSLRCRGPSGFQDALCSAIFLCATSFHHSTRYEPASLSSDVTCHWVFITSNCNVITLTVRYSTGGNGQLQQTCLMLWWTYFPMMKWMTCTHNVDTIECQ